MRASRRLAHPSCSEALSYFLGGEIPGHWSSWLQDRHFVTRLFLANLQSVPLLTAPTHLTSLATRGLGTFLGTLLEDVARTLCIAASMRLTRNLWELVGPPAAPCSFRSEQAHSTPVPRTIFHARFHLLQHPACHPIELSEVAPDCKTPLGPEHAVGSLTEIDVTAEHRECSNLFRIDASWPCFHRLLSDLSSLTSKSFQNQRSLRLSQTVLQHSQPRFLHE